MTPTINTIKTRLAEVASSVPGIKRAYDEAPMSLPAADLPIFCSFVGPVVSFDKMSDQLGEEVRQFICRLYVVYAQQGYDGNAEKAVEPFLTSLRDVFLSHPRLGLGTMSSQIPFVLRMAWQGDSGITVLPFAGESYLGAEFRLNVSTVIPIGVANYE